MIPLSRRLGLALAACAVFGACATSAIVFVSPAYDPKSIVKVGVLGFSDYPGAPGSGAIVASVFEKYLLLLGYNVIERDQIQAVLKEQSFDASGSVDPSTVQAMGKLLGADGLVVGNVSEYAESSEQTEMVNVPQENTQPVFGQTGANTVGVTGYQSVETDTVVPETETLPAEVGFTVRLISVKTGELLWSGSSEGVDGDDPGAAAEEASAAILQSLKKQLAAQPPSAPQ